jgi:hypothetical protein
MWTGPPCHSPGSRRSGYVYIEIDNLDQCNIDMNESYVTSWLPMSHSWDVPMLSNQRPMDRHKTGDDKAGVTVMDPRNFPSLPSPSLTPLPLPLSSLVHRRSARLWTWLAVWSVSWRPASVRYSTRTSSSWTCSRRCNTMSIGFCSAHAPPLPSPPPLPPLSILEG